MRPSSKESWAATIALFRARSSTRQGRNASSWSKESNRQCHWIDASKDERLVRGGLRRHADVGEAPEPRGYNQLVETLVQVLPAIAYLRRADVIQSERTEQLMKQPTALLDRQALPVAWKEHMADVREGPKALRPMR